MYNHGVAEMIDSLTNSYKHFSDILEYKAVYISTSFEVSLLESNFKKSMMPKQMCFYHLSSKVNLTLKDICLS